VRTYQKRFGTGESRESILAKKNDPRLQSVMMRDLTNANEDVLRRSGVPLTAGNYYLAHFAGAGGAVKLNRNLDAPVERILGQKAVDANPFLTGLTGRDVVQWAAHKMGGEATPLAAGHMVDFPVRPSERPDDTMFRGPDHSNVDSPDAYGFDPIEGPQHRSKPFESHTFNMGEGDGGGRTSKTAAELNQPGARGEGMATGGMGRPFKADPNTGDFENVQRERVKQAEAETEKRFEARRAEAERLKAEFEARRNRAGQSDASARYQQFGSKPHFDPDRPLPHDRRRLCGRRGRQPGCVADAGRRGQVGGSVQDGRRLRVAGARHVEAWQRAARHLAAQAEQRLWPACARKRRQRRAGAA
jgi:hypothetical protein